MIAQLENKTISLDNLIVNILHFLGREDEEIKIILKNITSQRIIVNQNFYEKNDVAENIAWENMVLWLEKEYYFSKHKFGETMNGAIAIKKGIEKIGCSVYGLPNFIENIFMAIKVLEFYSEIPFESIIEKLKEAGALLEKQKLIQMDQKCKEIIRK